MRKPLLTGLVGVVVMSTSANAQSVKIEHQPAACAVSEKFPRFEARFLPPESVAVARILFQGENRAEWFAVVMKPEGASFAGVLPKPKKSLKAFRYYIEVTDKALSTSRSTEYTTQVVSSSGECSGKAVAGTLGSASVLLQGPAGAAALPAGFASTGVTAAGSASGAVTGAATGGGGLSTGAIVGIVGGVGAAAGVAVVAAKGGTSYAGSFSGTLAVSYNTQAGQACSNTHALSGTLEIRLGGAADTFQFAGTKTQTSGSTICPSSGNFGIPDGGSVTGAPGAVAFKALRNESGFGPGVEFSGALNGGSISGTLTFTYLAGTTVVGSVSIPVTLR